MTTLAQPGIGDAGAMSKNRISYLRRTYCRRQASYLWGQKRIIKPVLLPIQFGDGKQLIALRPITTRTHHYVVAVNSLPDWFSPGGPLLHDHLDAIYAEIDDKFGDITLWYEGEEPERGNCDPFKEWPAICLNIGCEWWSLNRISRIPKSKIQNPKSKIMITDFWSRPATIERNNFIHKSLSCWSFNHAVGCEHACRFCYVPGVSVGKGAMAAKIKSLGVEDPDAQWGDYVFVRPWNKDAFLSSLNKAQLIPHADLNPDGNRAVMMCTTTDPFQVLRHVDPIRRQELQLQLDENMSLGLQMIYHNSDLNVRILTRSPLARKWLSFMRAFENRLLFGMSIPTLRNDLAKIYEPKAPAPTQRLATLKAAKAAGLNIYVAVAPVYPECDEEDMANTLREIAKLDPVTIFMEPINMRAENVERIRTHAESLGVQLKTEVFATTKSWAVYARQQLRTFQLLARDFCISNNVLHLWPDKALASHFPEDRDALQHHWNKISQWPK